MAKYSGQVSYKGLVSIEDERIFITESKKDPITKEIVEEKFDITEKLREYDGKNASFTAKEEKDLEPIEE